MSEEVKTEKTDAATPEASQPQTAPLKGLVGFKIGMTRVFTDEAHMETATVVSTEGVIVTMVKTKANDGYDAVQVGVGDMEEKKVNKAMAGHFAKNKVAAKRHLHEFRVKDVSGFQVGQSVPATVFAKGEWLQVSGLTKGHGYAGVMKRHGFAGLPHSHGNGEYRRHPGTNGAQGPQHVLPGTRKAGHMGHAWSTIPKIEVLNVLPEKNLVVLRGSIPGPKGNFVVLKPTSKHVKAKAAAAPTATKHKVVKK